MNTQESNTDIDEYEKEEQLIIAKGSGINRLAIVWYW